MTFRASFVARSATAPIARPSRALLFVASAALSVSALGCGKSKAEKPMVHVEVAGLKRDLPIDVVLHGNNVGMHSIILYANCPAAACLPSGELPFANDLKGKCPAIETVRLNVGYPTGKSPAQLPTGNYTSKPNAEGGKASGSYGSATVDHNLWGTSFDITSSAPYAGKFDVKEKDTVLTGAFANAVHCGK